MNVQKKSRIRTALWRMSGFLFIIVLLYLVPGAIGTVESGQNRENKHRLEDTIKKAVINCYTIEGRYPATLEYVEEYYGLQIDKEQYTVFYEIFADNIMPEITVLEK